MSGYGILAVVLTVLVDFLLLMGTDRLCGYSHKPLRCALGATVGGTYALLCLKPGFHFLGNPLWHVLFTGLVAWTAFGTHITALGRGAVFSLLYLAVNGLLGNGAKSLWGALLAGGGVLLLSTLGFKQGISPRYIPVELSYGGRHLKLTALRDTGNTLIDPVSGQSVLVVGADAAQALTGLTREQLCQPVESIGTLPGLRLIPYKTVGTDCAFMLGLRIGQVQVGSHCGSRVVAFSPQQLGSHYQALTGGLQ